MLRLRTSSIFNSQHVATGWLNACNMLRPTMLRSVAFKRCDRLAGACSCWANNVGICCFEVLPSFGRALSPGLYLGVLRYAESMVMLIMASTTHGNSWHFWETMCSTLPFVSKISTVIVSSKINELESSIRKKFIVRMTSSNRRLKSAFEYC